MANYNDGINTGKQIVMKDDETKYGEVTSISDDGTTVYFKPMGLGYANNNLPLGFRAGVRRELLRVAR